MPEPALDFAIDSEKGVTPVVLLRPHPSGSMQFTVTGLSFFGIF
jgi:hypothetical protein